MPRKPIDWSKALFYRLVCRDPTITECYVGSTTNETKRRNDHKTNCTNQNDKTKYNYFVYRFIRDHGGWQNWQLIVIEQRPVNNKLESLIRERFFVEQYKAKLNSYIPSRTQAEYYVDNADEIIKKSAAYSAANSERLKTKHTFECGGRYTTASKAPT